MVAQSVIVLAKNFTSSTSQFQLLQKGLTFVPTLDLTRGQRQQFQFDLYNYHRKLTLAAYFKDSPDRQQRPFMPPSEWVPPPDKILKEINQLIEADMGEFKIHYKYRGYKAKTYNLPQTEGIALRELAQAKHIVMKPADKGSATVIMSREQYVHEVNRQLNDTNYKKLDKPIYLTPDPPFDQGKTQSERKPNRFSGHHCFL